MSILNKNTPHIVCSRRQMLQGMLCALVAGSGLVLPLQGHAAEAQKAQKEQNNQDTHKHQDTSKQGKTLIVYYSRTGNTRAVAKNIQELTKGDLVEIHTVHPYPEDYKATTEQAKKELAEGHYPPITTKVDHLEQYSHVFVGSPNWWGTVAPPVMTFLSKHDLKGKTIHPFITHEGSALGHSVSDIKKLSPKSTVTHGYEVRGRNAADSKATLSKWLQSMEK